MILSGPAATDEALRRLRRGEVVGLPTDTVYGLAADPADPQAVRRLFTVKSRPVKVELPILVADLAQAGALVAPGAVDGGVGGELVARFWPGPLTVVVARRPGLDWELGGDGATVGVRCPDDELVRALCRTAGPLTVTSANEHGRPPLTEAAAVEAVFGPTMLVVEGGRRDAPPSTVVDLTCVPPRVLRRGAVADEVQLLID